LIEGAILGAGLTLSFMMFINGITKDQSNQTIRPISEIFASPLYTFVLLLVLGFALGFVWLAWFLFDQTIKSIDKQIESYRRGEEGENKVVELMGQVLDGNWFLLGYKTTASGSEWSKKVIP